MASGSSVSTVGGINFDILARGESKGYSFRLVDLNHKTFDDATASLLENVNNTLQDLETQSGKTIESFCIGKSYVGGRVKKVFKPTDAETWTKAGVAARWKKTYRGEGYDGLVVLAAVTRKMTEKLVTNNINKWNQERYALALEGRLITQFAFQKNDKRLANKTLAGGAEQGGRSAGYVVYVAYKYR